MDFKHTIVGVGAGIPQTHLAVALDGVNGGANASVVAGITGSIFIHGSVNARGSAGRDVVGDVEGHGKGRHGR